MTDLRAEAERTTHELKTWPDYFCALLDGSKTFEYRRNDREFKVGDVLRLREWEPTFQQYTGREMNRKVTYILPTSPTFVILALDSAAAESRGAQRALREAAEAAERFAQEFPEMPFAQYVSANALRARAEALSSAQQGQ
jgi:hypothetical protein